MRGDFVEKTDVVVLKGTAQGVKMILDSDTPVMQVLEAMRAKVKEAENFFKGKCTVFVCGRRLDNSDRLRITSVMHTILPDAEVCFGEPHTSSLSTQSLDVPDNFKRIVPNRSMIRFHHGDIKSGEAISAAGDIFVFGNIEKGGHIYSAGSIYIMGRLAGFAHAGIENEKNAVIAAADFMPDGISIAALSTIFDNNTQKKGSKIAYLTNDTIFLHDFL